MSTIRLALCSVASLVALFLAGGCNKGKDRSVARLEEITATVERSSGPGGAWQLAQLGDRFALGSAVRTGDASKARLRVGKNGVLLLEANAIVRFVSDPAQQRSDVRVEAGNVEVQAGDEQLAIGEAVLEPNGRARLSQGGDGLTIAVTVGQVMLEGTDGQPVALAAGQSVTVKIGGAILEQAPPPPPVDAGVAAPDAGTDDAAPGAGNVVKVSGKPARQRGATGWQPLAVGEHQLAPGTRIDAPAGSVVSISHEGGRLRTTSAADVIVGDEGSLATIKRGSIVLEAESADAIVTLPGGNLVAHAGSEASAKLLGKGATEIEGRRGDAEILTAISEETLQAGDIATLNADGTIAFQNRAPTRVAFSFAAGESVTIHDPKAPTAVRVRFGNACGNEGRLDVARDRNFRRMVARTGGRAGGNALLPAGAYTYRVRCANKKVVRGSIRVVRDAGHKPLPRAAPRTLVEPDGREYVISYQNLLPELTLVWRDAPARSSYQFVILPAAGEARRIKSATPRVSLKSGELAEGSYKFWVEIPETGGRSDEARILIDFDNAAATASIERVQAKNGKLAVTGTAIEGTTVSSGESRIPLDRHQRFNIELAPQGGEDRVAIRIAHPKLGVHYYVLRSGK